jgi:predicted AAA+ superfamily ATPase
MELEELASQSPWWHDRRAIEQDEKVRKVLEAGERVVFELGDESSVLVGPRQLGKTTALKYDIYRKIVRQGVDPASIMYRSFDTSRSFEEIEGALNAFAEVRGRKFIYLDEVSFVDQWQRAVKHFLDSEASRDTTLYVTGSSSINLRKELMPGRRIRFAEFLPLSFRQFLKSFGSAGLREALGSGVARDFGSAVRGAAALLPYFREISRHFDAYVRTGGYPDAIFGLRQQGKVSDDIYDLHWNAFVSDVSKGGKSVEIATAVVYGLVISYSSKVSLSGIARMQGIKSHVTVREYIEAFDDLFVTRSVFPTANRRYVFRKERKVYFSDPFLYWMFSKKLGIEDKDAESKVAEGILHSHIYRFVNRGKGLAEPKTMVGFLSGRREVDFASEGWGFELKWRRKVDASKFPKAGIRKRLLLSRDTMDLDGEVKVVPLALFLAML